jgi:tetratricopeptide (TPR) repeat protein
MLVPCTWLAPLSCYVMSGWDEPAGHAFISYVREDSHQIDRLQQTLQAAGIPVWRDTADLWPGEDWRVKIRRAIADNALIFIACFSKASLSRSKSYQNEELVLAIEQLRMRPPDYPWLIPVRFDDCEIPDRDIGSGRTLASIQRADLFGDRNDEGIARLVAAILRILGRTPQGAAQENVPIQVAAEKDARLSRTSREADMPTEEDPAQPSIWGREIPFRNSYFTGRRKELAELRKRLADSSTTLSGQQAVPLYGLGGVGKTEIAVEYVHRFRDHYRICWWVRSEQEDMIMNSLLNLGWQLQLSDLRLDERDYSVGLVLDALSHGQPISDWLLIFDNAPNAEMVARYIPRGRGHVIVTSRAPLWRKALGSEGIEVTEFELSETIEFLRKRVPALAEIQTEPGTRATAAENEKRLSDATELAEVLGNLPVAADHAAAYLAETGISAQDYLDAFRKNAHGLFAENVDIPYPHVVATTWDIARQMISPEADALFSLMAFYGPEPIAEELFLQHSQVIAPTDALQRVLNNPSEFRQAARQLARFSLVSINGIRNVIQIHRVVQAVTRGRLIRELPDAASDLRAVAHSLLAASDPNTPDRDDSEKAYERSLPHIVATDALQSADPLVRQLIINQVRRLHRRGRFSASLSLGEAALTQWQAMFGPDDYQTLFLAVEIGPALRGIGRWQEARRLNSDTLRRLENHSGREDNAYLECAQSYGVDLSILGRYHEALENDQHLLHDYERELGSDHLNTLELRSNITINLRCLGKFEEALECDRLVFAERQRILGPTDTGTLTSRLAIARNLRMLGRAQEALDVIRDVYEILEQKDDPWNQFRLVVSADFAVSLRRAGYHAEAAEQGEMVLQKYLAVLGETHRGTLRASINVTNDRRNVDDLAGAQELGERTVAAWEQIAGADHPNTVAARATLAVVLRLRGNPRAARDLDQHALEDFTRVFGKEHPSPLVVMTNLASDLSAIGEGRQALELGERSLELHRHTRGTDHPFTLATAANLSVDRRVSGDATGAAELHNDTVARYNETLGAEHPESRLADQQARLTIDIEPMMD